MSKWTERFESHPLFSTLDDIKRKLDQTADLASGDSNRVEDHERVKQLVSEVERRVKRVDPILPSQGTLNGINNHFQKTDGHLQSFINNRNASELEAATTTAENALTVAVNLPLLENAQDVEALQESVISVRRSLAQHARHAQEEAERAQAAVTEVQVAAEELEAQITAQKARLDTAIENTQERFTAAEAERAKQLESALVAARTQLDEVAEKFRVAQEARHEGFKEKLDEWQEHWVQWSGEIAERDKRVLAKREAEAEKRLAAMDGLKKQAEDVVGVIGQTGMVGGYQKQANIEKRTRLAFQIVTIVALVLFAAVLVWGIPGEPEATGPANWVGYAHRMVIGLAFAAIAAFASREASKHGERERRYRKAELEIASVGPFLVSLPQAEQNAIRKEFADRVFGREVNAATIFEMPASANGLVETLQLVVRELLDIAKTK
jgi:hypothetical protein